MAFVELQRSFVAIEKDQQPNLEVGRIWGRKVAGWLGWPELLDLRRVVLLAEASSGKSEEFRNQVKRLGAEGRAAFFVTIEELADHGFETALEPASIKAFEQWHTASGDGWFFLDSLDEARLNRKSFETAIKRFARAVDPALERTRVFISCRFSDWKGAEDRELIERFLPAWELPNDIAKQGDALLDPLFKERKQSETRPSREPARKPYELLIVQLAPLQLDQCQVLATHHGVSDAEAFINGITQHGLEVFAERPGDVIDLANYWEDHRRFGSFSEMVEYGINRKLSEIDKFRPDNDTLPLQKARFGAESLAAALTLGKSFTLRAPQTASHESAAERSIDAGTVLDDWTEAERNALLRRGVFAPATYGRVRFHHRSTQEYLTARWLENLLRGTGTREDVWNLIFTSCYGVDTIVPSLRPAAAWLALWQSDFRAEIIAREPLILIRDGDPGSLPIGARKQLLIGYAAKQADSEVSDDRLDSRAIWMFADPQLTETVRQVWNTNQERDFRFDMLRLIREGVLVDCADLARNVALDRAAPDHHRVVALQALKDCKDRKSLSAAARDLLSDAANLSPRLSTDAAKLLYPQHLTLEELFTFIEKINPPTRFSSEGFHYAINDLYNCAPDAKQRDEFASRLATLCLSQPFVEDYQRVSARYFALAQYLAPIALQEVQALGDRAPPQHVVCLLMAVERAHNRHDTDNISLLSKTVQSKPKIQRCLLWADTAEQRSHSSRHNDPIHFADIMPCGPSLWALEEADLGWLYEDLIGRPNKSDQRIALSAIVTILRNINRLEPEVVSLQALIGDRQHLRAELALYLAPPASPNAEWLRHEREMANHRRKFDLQKSKDEDSWKEFAQELRQNPQQLSNPVKIGTWKTGGWRLWDLTRWLMHRVEGRENPVPTQWRLLEEGFGREVAEAYCNGLRHYWRLTKPEPPRRNSNGSTTTKYSSILAFGAVAVEAAEDASWSTNLLNAEVRRAALHGILSDQGYPVWIEVLAAAHPQAVLPIIKRAITGQYLSGVKQRADFVYHYAHSPLPIPLMVQVIFFNLIKNNEPVDLNKFDCMFRIVSKIDISPNQRRELFKVAVRRFLNHKIEGRKEETQYSLSLLLVLNLSDGISYLTKYLFDVPSERKKDHAEETFAFLFDRHNFRINTTLHGASITDLESLLRLVYTHISPAADIPHEGAFTPDTRDNAESARNLILSAVLERSGADAYQAMRRVSAAPEFALRANRFKELARGMAERDSELVAWTPEEIRAFQREYTAPVKTGGDLLHAVEAALKDIQFQFRNGDASSRQLLQHAQNEEEVQNWLVEQLNFRSRGRYRAFREAQVAMGNKPDVLVASTSAPCEVAIEIKRSKKWTLRQLDNALRKQLAEDYLKPEARRHGILVVTHHHVRNWHDPETNQPMTFDALMAHLKSVAQTLDRNVVGAIEVRCVGIDAT